MASAFFDAASEAIEDGGSPEKFDDFGAVGRGLALAPLSLPLSLLHAVSARAPVTAHAARREAARM
ncbi:hypothetical protein GCM10010431_14750 [Streptomyces kunmingensis]